ncbi:hypothetical protein SLEP1_g51648 [Rubroshorea leprosula]|uniref:Integrase catalytic domain-containing protein n=1 Tax=Rubroshorea leprosula TaxID=152421 RepID=A0AAV5M3U7_9ROSI|nr:hypothetical protein SLEP1_g51648 [Rubroshorea leprosula]
MEDWQRRRAIKAEKRLARLQGRDPRDEPMWVPHIRVTFPQPAEIFCPSLDGYVVKHMDVLYVDPEGTVFIDRLLEIGECSKQARFEEVVVEEITDEVYSDDEEDSFGFNNLFGLANMTDPKERWRRMLVERAFIEKHPNFQLIHHANAPMDPHESVLLETVKEESLCDSWGNLTINALDDEGLEFDRGISLVNGSSQANWAAELFPVAFISDNMFLSLLYYHLAIYLLPSQIFKPANDESLNNDAMSDFIYEIDDQTYKEEDNENLDPSHELTQMLREEKPKLQPNQETETINLGTEDDKKEIKINAHLSSKERNELIELLFEFQDVFAWSYKDMPGFDPDITVHAIPLYSEAKPVKQKLRRMKPEEWVANIVPIMKKDGRVRVFVDYRDLNKASPKDDFPLPHIQILLDNAAKNARFFFVDGYSGYNQIKMKEEDKLKTTFITQWAIVDDMVIMSKEEVLHIENLKKVFERLRRYKMRLNPAKCTFDVDSGKLLGFIAIKGQAIADHLAKHAAEDYEPIDWDFPDEDILALEAESNLYNWKLFFDGAVNQLGCGLGAVLVSPKGDHFPIAIKLDFACTNNIAKYEACIAGIHAALDMNVQDLEIYASNGHQFILVAIDYFTKWVEAASYASVTKKVVTRFIKREIICRYGQQEAIITDNASNLNNDMMTALCKQFKIKHLNSSPYRPKTNGAVEAANKNIKKILAKMAVTYKDWHEMLPYALHAYRTSVRTSTGATPYSLAYGMEAVLPIELEIPSMRILSESGIDEEDLIQKRIDYLNLLDEKRLAALCHGQCYQRRMEATYNKKVKPRVFHQGDLVLRKIMPNERDPRGKFAPNYEGPYVVKEAFSGGALLLRYPDGIDYHRPVNADAVKMYYC